MQLTGIAGIIAGWAILLTGYAAVFLGIALILEFITNKIIKLVKAYSILIEYAWSRKEFKEWRKLDKERSMDGDLIRELKMPAIVFDYEYGDSDEVIGIIAQMEASNMVIAAHGLTKEEAFEELMISLKVVLADKNEIDLNQSAIK